MTLAKSSLVLLIRRLMSPGHLVIAYLPLAVLVLAYFVVGIFATAFQCGIHIPWVLEPATCPTHGRLLYVVIGMNMVTDGFLATWNLPSLWKLNMGKNSRTVVIALFASRIMYDSGPNLSYLLT